MVELKVCITVVGRIVMAMYPDTTSFYRSTLVQLAHKAPRPSGEKSREVMCGIQFFDDEDVTGVSPKRLVPAKFVFVPKGRV